MTGRQDAYNTYAALKVISDAAIENARIKNNEHLAQFGNIDLTASYNIDAAAAKLDTDDAYAIFLDKDNAYNLAVDAYLKYVEAEGLAYSNSLVLRMEIISSNPRCPIEHSYTGRRDTTGDSGIVVTPPEPPLPPFVVKQVYYIMNTVLVKTLPGNVSIEVKGISMKIDRDSWLWPIIVTGKQIGRASCRERVSSPV